MVRWLALVGIAAGCAARQAPDTRGWAEHMEAARVHEMRAAEHERAAQFFGNESLGPIRYKCGDLVLNDQLNSGGRPLTTWMPCLDLQTDARLRHEMVARHERIAARRERAAAAALLRHEVAACDRLPPQERARSVFEPRERIATIAPIHEGPELRGVRILFARDAGLTAGQVFRDIECRRARWAISGQPPQLAQGDPTLVRDASVSVTERAGQVEVVITTGRPDQAQLALAYARGQVEGPGPESAQR